MMKRLIFLCASVLLLAAGTAQAAPVKNICGPVPMPGQSGPWDYRLGKSDLFVLPTPGWIL